VIPVVEGVGCQCHGEVGLARGAREAAADVLLAAGLLVEDAQQHEPLGQERARRPAVVGSLPQAVCDLAQQCITALGRAVMQDRALVGHGSCAGPRCGGR
jgi:hypothetical protein